MTRLDYSKEAAAMTLCIIKKTDREMRSSSRTSKIEKKIDQRSTNMLEFIAYEN